MDAMVTARVPVEIKKQVDRKLHEIGSSATALINAAYQYVLDHGELPGQKPASKPEEPLMKVLSGDDALEFNEHWNSMKVIDTQGYDGTNFKELLNKSREERHENLA